MVLLMILVLLNALQRRFVGHAHGLHQRIKILQIEVSVRASMGLPGTRRVLRQNLLAAEWTVAATTPI